jgi:lipid II:glycine glycyltransferase (peptidoglycan interpeptide bridge formation enzyme)
MFITERKFGLIKIVNVYFIIDSLSTNVPECDVIIYHTYKDYGEIEGFDRIHFLTTTIDLSQSLDDIWNNIEKQHKRQIRRAEREGTTVSVNEKFSEFQAMYKGFLKRKNYANPIELNVMSLKFMQTYGTLFIAENHGELLCGYYYYHDENNALLVKTAYHQIENSMERKKQISDANCYIQWEAMKYFKSRNIIHYDLGGGILADEKDINHPAHGLDFFKRSFGGDIISHYSYRKFNSQFYKFLFHCWVFLSKKENVLI